jgi:signal transduction histidine kinase
MTDNEIKKIRFKLAVLYFLIIFVILNAYALITSSLNYRTFESAIPIPAGIPAEADFEPKVIRNLSVTDRETLRIRVVDAQNKVILTNITWQFILLTISASVSYILAGMTIEPITQAYKQQVDFVMRASHELKTPLTIIKLHSELLAKSTNEKDLQTFRVSVNEEVNHIQNLVNRLLQSIKLSKWKNKVLDKVNFNETLSTVLNRYQKLAVQKKIILSSTLNLTSNIQVKCGRQELEEIISALLDNAIKYNKKNGKVEILVSFSKQKLTFVVKDWGIGIEQERLTKIFARFHRGDHPQEEGFGLGLTIVKQLVEEYGGTINITSELGKGTTAVVVLERA